jgi:hypothetical protein
LQARLKPSLTAPRLDKLRFQRCVSLTHQREVCRDNAQPFNCSEERVLHLSIAWLL